VKKKKKHMSTFNKMEYMHRAIRWRIEDKREHKKSKRQYRYDAAAIKRAISQSHATFSKIRLIIISFFPHSLTSIVRWLYKCRSSCDDESKDKKNASHVDIVAM
jgi:hypothetical protein